MQESFLFCRDANLFGIGPPVYIPTIPWIKRRTCDRASWKEASATPNVVMTPDGKHEVTPETFFYHSTGAARAQLSRCLRYGVVECFISISSSIS
jgi:hypothetical protein